MKKFFALLALMLIGTPLGAASIIDQLDESALERLQASEKQATKRTKKASFAIRPTMLRTAPTVNQKESQSKVKLVRQRVAKKRTAERTRRQTPTMQRRIRQVRRRR